MINKIKASLCKNFSVTFRLKTKKYEDDILNKRFSIAKKMYNSLINITQKRYKEMIKTKRYRNIMNKLSEIYKSKLEEKQEQKNMLYAEKAKMLEEYKISKYSFHADIKQLQKHFKKNIDSFTTQKIADHLWKAYSKLLYGNGKKIHYKRYDEIKSLEGKSNSTGIKFRNNHLEWNGLKIKVDIDNKNYYECEALKNEISYCRITRKFVRTKYKYYLQIIFKGMSPVKINSKTGEFKRKIGNGKVGLDIGTQTIAIVSQTDVKLLELADKVQNIENKKRLLLRKMDRSRRANNPNNFNIDGTIKKQGNKKVEWKKSKVYIKTKDELKQIYRKQADIRKYQHEILSNYIISLGNEVYVEKMNFKGLQKRADKTEVNEITGKYNKKKRFGKSIANKAPAMLLEIIDRKLGYYGEQLIKINTKTVKASQYNHITNEYTKKGLGNRWNDEIEIQRDLYSAFLIMNVKSNLSEINKNLCEKTYDNFKQKHDKEIERLRQMKSKGTKIISSMGI